MNTTEVRWDLSEMFSGPEDERILETLQNIIADSEAFEAKYKGKLDVPDLSAQTLLEALEDIQSIYLSLAIPGAYASLLFAADTSNHLHGALMQKVMVMHTQAAVHLIFFDLEINDIEQEVLDRILNSDILADYRHYIGNLRKYRDHLLSEPEEILLERTANTGSRAFERLFEEVVSSLEFKIKLEGEDRVLSEPEVLALLRHHDRETRRLAAESLTAGLLSQSKVLTFIFNNLVYDKAVGDDLRDFEYPEQQRHMSNELDSETVEMVIDQCVQNYGLVERYYNIKRDILGYDQLTHYDRYAPLFEVHQERSFEDAKQIVLESFGAFSDEMRQVAEQFFDRKWIDAEPRAGKRGGAFCSYVSTELHPFVLMSYLNKSDDVMTLGHELGHGVHASVSQIQKYVNHHSALPVAELASTFGEMLVFEKLVAASDQEDKLALYAEKIESIFATVFRQAAMYRFEQRLHRKRKEQELTREEIGEIWQEEMKKMFGSSVNLEDEHANWWMYVNHFIGSPFYVYAYSVGELLVLSLYAAYKKEGQEFVPKYMDMLRAGGSCSPEELLKRVDIDIKDPKFWEGGFREISKLMEEFVRLRGNNRA